MARDHLVWDWNGTLLNDVDLVVRATNLVFTTMGGRVLTVEEHRLQFRRPVAEFYAAVLERAVDAEEFDRLDKIFHDAYRDGLTTCVLADDAPDAMRAWTGSQSLLSMAPHDDLVPTLTSYGLDGSFTRVDGLRTGRAGGTKAEHLVEHLAALDVDAGRAVLIGDSIDDADAAIAVGAACVLYTGGFTAAERLRASGHPVAETLAEAVALAQSERK
jgi:phosphoglycolate phosphatase-like HAD superfamily hydrolase